MMNRRKFIEASVGGAVALLPAAAALAGTGPQQKQSAIVVHDVRCPDPQQALATLGIDAGEVHRIAGDMTDIWSNHLKPAWARGRALTAGVTWDAEYFVLKTLARDQGYKVVYEQRAADASGAVTWVLAPA